jgi:excisionase family DNA binding protein
MNGVHGAAANRAEVPTDSPVAELLHVSPKTVSRWAQEGRLPYLRTLGGHRRYPDVEIRALVETLSERSAGQPPTWSS